MISIKINTYNETLESSGKVNYKSEFRYKLIHSTCLGIITQTPISKTHNVLVCEQCLLRVVVPKDLKTFEDLDNHFKNIVKDQDFKIKILRKEEILESDSEGKLRLTFPNVKKILNSNMENNYEIMTEGEIHNLKPNKLYTIEYTYQIEGI